MLYFENNKPRKVLLPLVRDEVIADYKCTHLLRCNKHVAQWRGLIVLVVVAMGYVYDQAVVSASPVLGDTH